MKKLNKINYQELNAKQKEIYNFQKISAVLAEYGFNCIKLADDWQGADFLAYHKDGGDTMKVQLKGKGGFGIYKKYQEKEIWMALPVQKKNKQITDWYLVEHDKLVEIIGKNTNWLNTDSWKVKGAYTTLNPSEKLLSSLEGYKLC